MLLDEKLERGSLRGQDKTESTQQTDPDSTNRERDLSSTSERLHAILGPWSSKLGTAVTPQEVKDIWRQHLEEKYLDPR